jgi:hypothetical protein
MELVYEYGQNWNVRLMFFFRREAETSGQIRCIAGAGASPPESLGGPLRFRRFVSALNRDDLSGHRDGLSGRQAALTELGADFDSEHFDAAACNAALDEIFKDGNQAPQHE